VDADAAPGPLTVTVVVAAAVLRTFTVKAPVEVAESVVERPIVGKASAWIPTRLIAADDVDDAEGMLAVATD
jgi:hypothetical protein